MFNLRKLFRKSKPAQETKTPQKPPQKIPVSNVRRQLTLDGKIEYHEDFMDASGSERTIEQIREMAHDTLTNMSTYDLVDFIESELGIYDLIQFAQDEYSHLWYDTHPDYN